MKNLEEIKLITMGLSEVQTVRNNICYSWYDLQKKAGISCVFKMDYECNIPISNTIMGLYMQVPPFQQNLLISCRKGKMIVIVIDLRKESSSYLSKRIVTLQYKSSSYEMLYVPSGCAYSFLSLEDETIAFIKSDNYLSIKDEKIYNLADPMFNITLPFEGNDGVAIADLIRENKVSISAKDRYAPFYSNMQETEEKKTEKDGDIPV